MAVSILEGGFALNLAKAAIVRSIQKGEIHHSQASEIIAIAEREMIKAAPNNVSDVQQIANDLREAVAAAEKGMLNN